MDHQIPIISDSALNDKTIFPNLPKSGPLKKYRQMAKFDWRKMALIMESEESLRFKIKNRPHLSLTFINGTKAYDVHASGKLMLSFRLFPYAIDMMGTDRVQKYIEQSKAGEISGSFSLTEIAHGSNAFGMRTQATYDRQTEEFIIHTPDFEAAKCWPGNLGQSCTHTILYAQLYTPDGKCHGLNAFVVQIRDGKTLKALPGVTVGDIGEKIGLNGIDNGFLMFNHFRIPRENLLAKYGDVTVDGQFVTPIKDPKKRYAALFGALSSGRSDIAAYSNVYMVKALTIALRYSASRLQFGPENSDEEFAVLEYQAQQYRLIPHLATTFVQKIFTTWLDRKAFELHATKQKGQRVPIGSEMEMHALSSIAKVVCTWSTRDAMKDCREACGGHGYLKISGIGDIKNDSDGAISYEGENNVLIQQASNWLLGIRAKGYDAFSQLSPFGSATFLKDFQLIVNNNNRQQPTDRFQFNTINDAINPKNLLNAFDWLCAWILEKTSCRVDLLRGNNLSNFEIRNDIQVFYAITLSMVYGQRIMFKTFYEYILKLERVDIDGKTTRCERIVLIKLLSLYGANLLLNYLGLFYEGGAFIGGGGGGANGTNKSPGELLQLGILQLLEELKSEAIALIDSVAPTDFILNSPLGMSDGLIYKHLQSALFQTPSVFERPEWWQDIVNWENYVGKGKL